MSDDDLRMVECEECGEDYDWEDITRYKGRDLCPACFEQACEDDEDED